MLQWKERFEHLQQESYVEHQEDIAELKRIHDMEKSLLSEENVKLTTELDSALETRSRIQLEKRQLEDEMKELREKKESVAQWEDQISEIIQWYNTEVLFICPISLCIDV